MPFKLIPEQARKLYVEALKSGEYRQCTGVLRDGDKFCAGGVACDLFCKHEVDIYCSGYYGGGYEVTVPPIIHQWLDDDIPLIDYNDIQGLAFPQIGKLLEERWGLENQSLSANPSSAV